MNRPSHRSCTLHRSAYQRSWPPLLLKNHLKAFIQAQMRQRFPGRNTLFAPSTGGLILVQHESEERKVSPRASLREFVRQDAGREHVVFPADSTPDAEHPLQVED